MQDYMKEYEEYKTLSPFWGWVVLIIFSILLLSYGMVAHMFIKEAETRYWSFGALPIAPGDSKYNTNEDYKNDTVHQISELPQAYPDERLSSDTVKIQAEIYK